MSTVNNVVLANVEKNSGVRSNWPQYWSATRAMKKCGWKVLASSDGTSKTVTDDPALDEWGVGAISNSGATDASTGALAGGRMTVTTGGTPAFTPADKGRFLSLTGATSAGNNHYHQIEEFISTTEVRVDARRSAFTPVATDASNGSITWEVRDPTTEARDTALDAAIGWILMRGPSTVKVPIAVAPVDGAAGTFIRGENIVQTTTAAEGEFLGYVFDSGNATGYVVILPRVIGSGGDPYGWATGGGSNTLTGDTSGATVDQSGTAVEYAQQVVLSKEANDDSGHMYIQCIDPVGESADDFATLAADADCLAGRGPGQGGGGGGNDFPAIAFSSIGPPESTTGAKWVGTSIYTALNANGQIIAVDAIWESGYSADGTWGVYSSCNTHGNGTVVHGSYQARGMYRLDDTEPGDLDPWVTFGTSGNHTLYAGNRLNAGESATASPFQANCSLATQRAGGTGNGLYWRGWRNRGGIGTATDAYNDFEQMYLAPCQTASNNIGMVDFNSDGGDNVVTEPVITRAREPVRVGSLTTLRKMRKGTVRHLQMVTSSGVGGPNSTLDDGKFLVLHEDNGAYVVGPWDEVSVPTSV